MTTRRRFIQFGTLAAFGGLFSGLSGSVIGQMSKSVEGVILPSQSLNDPLLTFSAQHFQQFLGTAFELRNSQLRKGATFRLTQVKEISSKLNDGYKLESYSLRFEPVRGNSIPDGIYEFDHAGLGKFSMFIAPASPDPNCYEAIVNRLG